MKTLKALLVAITALSFSVANAGELSVTGSTKHLTVYHLLMVHQVR